MARSRRITALAEQCGRSPGTVEGHQRRGMWPDGSSDFRHHYEIMDLCGLGSGTEDWVVAMKAAAHYDWPVVRLRSVLQDRCPGWNDQNEGVADAAGTLMPIVLGFTSGHAYRSEALDPYRDGGPLDITARRDPETGVRVRPETPDHLATGMTVDAFGAVRRELLGQPTTPDDFASYAEIVDSAAMSIKGIVLDDEPGVESLAEPLSVPVHAEVKKIVANVSKWIEWIESASPEDLVNAVKMAMHVVEMLRLSSPDTPMTETQRWQYVAMFSPFLGIERTTISPVVTAMVENNRNLQSVDAQSTNCLKLDP